MARLRRNRGDEPSYRTKKSDRGLKRLLWVSIILNLGLYILISYQAGYVDQVIKLIGR